MENTKKLLVVILLLFAGCSSPNAKLYDSFRHGSSDLASRPEIYQELLKFPGTGKTYPAFTVRYEEEVDYFVRYYSNRGRSHVGASLSRQSQYQDVFAAIFSYYGLPRELLNVVAVESKYIEDAESPSGAYGLWQFMPATAREEGLKVGWFVDERGDAIKSTIAAARHFQKLYDRFGDWYLALAAYNGGVGTVSRAVRAVGSRDLFTLVRSEKLSTEVAQYVPKVVALTLIMKNLNLYGFAVNRGVDEHS